MITNVDIFKLFISEYVSIFALFAILWCFITVSPLKLQTGSRRGRKQEIGNALALI